MPAQSIFCRHDREAHEESCDPGELIAETMLVYVGSFYDSSYPKEKEENDETL